MEGGSCGADSADRAGTAASVDEDEIRRVASLMRIDIGEDGGDEARSHIEKVRTMIGYFDILDRAGGDGVDGVDGGAQPGAGGNGAGGRGIARLEDLREDEPEDGAPGAVPASRYARIQQEGGTYVRAPAMSP